ncbi:MFS transporter [Bifidobacterium fermentum]|uniref:MFS transporter n=2 Tax=Bifidobacterium fermentum TaxID=3059035 RepID=A0AB39UAY5_9BIFI
MKSLDCQGALKEEYMTSEQISNGMSNDLPPSQSKAKRATLLTSLGVSYLGLFMTYAGLVAILLPQQMTNLDASNKVNNLAFVTSLSAVATIFVQPIVGALSDRTRSKFGRRAPWILLGGFGGGLCTIAIQFANSLFWIALSWVAIQVLLNAFQGPLSAIISDRVESSDRGLASAMTGVGMSLGGTIGVIIAGQLLERIGIAYTFFGILVMVICLLFVVFNPGRPSDKVIREKINWVEFFKAFWVSPRQHPDFIWAFLGRFFMVLGYQAVTNYQLYIITDYIGVGTAQAGNVVSIMSVITLVTVTISTLAAGRLSDKLGRRKMFVGVATLFIAGSICIPLTMPTIMGMYLYGGLLGLGYGAYTSVDMAMMVDVLPSNDAAAKDLGILNIASNIPQALTPIIAAGLLSMFADNYQVLFMYSAIAAALSAIFVIPIKSVK